MISSSPVTDSSRPLTSDQDAFALKRVWESVAADSCPSRYNFHMHTSCSDGQLSPEALIEQALTIGLQGLAITDHHSVRGFIAARRWLEAAGKNGPHLWTGVEITSNLEGTEVHLLGYAFAPDCEALTPYLQGDRPHGEASCAERVIAAIHEAGGLAVLAHPSRYSQSAERLIPAAARRGIDGVEAYYAYGNPKPWQPSRQQTQLALQLAQEYGLLTTCGTDTHGSSLLRRI